MTSVPKSTPLDRVLAWISRAAPTRVTAAVGLGALWLLAAIATLCRLGGAVSQGPSTFGYCAALICAGLFCCGLKVIAEWPPHRLDRRGSSVFGILISLPLALFATALFPANWTYALGVSALAVSALVSWFCISMQSTVLLSRCCTEVIVPEIERFLFPSTVAVEISEASATTPLPMEVRVHAEPAGEVISDLQRRTTSSGDILEGQLVATFAAGSRQTVLHIPFTPPFALIPQLECEIADDSEVRIKVGAVFPYGARLELKRNGKDLAEQQVRLQIYAEAAHSNSEAA